MPLVGRVPKGHKGQEAPSTDPRQNRGAQDEAATGPPSDSCRPGTRTPCASHPNLLQANLSLDTFFSTAWMPPLKGGLWTEVGQRRSSCRGGAKESVSPSGARTRLNNRRDSDSLFFIFNLQKMSA